MPSAPLSSPLKMGVKSFFAASALLASTSLPAFALDAGDAVKRLEALVASGGGQFTYDAPQISGDSVTLTNATFKVEGEDFSIGDLVISGVTEGEDGKLNIAKFTASGFEKSDDELSVKSGEIVVSNFALPNVGDAVGQMGMSGEFVINGMQVAAMGKEFMSIKSISAKTVGDFPKTSIQQDFLLDDLNLNIANIPDGDQGKQMLTALGYEVLNFDITSNGSWDPSGVMKLSNLSLIGDDIGTIKLTLDLAGYTPEIAEKVAEIQTKMTGANSSAAGMELLGTLQALSLTGGQLKFTDNSITNKALNFFAPQMGTDAEGLKTQAKGFLPLMLGQLGNPELAKMVTAAVTTYLDDPKSIQIDIAPDAPVAFGEIMGAGMAAPQTLPDVVGATISANQ